MHNQQLSPKFHENCNLADPRSSVNPNTRNKESYKGTIVVRVIKTSSRVFCKQPRGKEPRRGGKNTQKSCTKKDLHDQDNHDGVITDLEPDIVECEVKWALESITTNKASGGDGIPVELFQILKYDAVKGLHSTCQQIWKTQQWPQDWKRSVLIPIPKKVKGESRSVMSTSATL